MGTISLTTTRVGSGPSSTIDLQSGDTANAASWHVGPINPTSKDDLSAAKEAIWNEIVRQMSQL